MVTVALLSLPSPYIAKIIIDRAIPSKDLHLLYLLIGTLISLLLAQVVVSYITNYSFNRLSVETITVIKQDLFSRVLRFPLSFFTEHQTGYILSRIGEVDGLTLFFSSTIITVLMSFIKFILCLVILVHLNLELTLMGLFFLPFLFGLTKLFRKDLRLLSWQSLEFNADLSRVIQDGLSGIEVVKCCGAETREIDKFHSRLKRLMDNNLKRARLMTIYGEGINLIGAAVGFIILWWSGKSIISDRFSLGSYFAFSAYFSQLVGPTQLLANFGLMLQPAKVALQRVHDLLSLDTEDSSAGRHRISSLKGDIEVRDIDFAYEPAKPVFTKASLIIRDGEKILLAGPNGSGKTTLIKLIMGFYYPQKGEISFNGLLYSAISPSSLRGRISLVSQNTFLFSDTIRNNVLYSSPESNDHDLIEAIRLSGAIDFIQRMPRGLETEIGERGVRLSGGERQKLSIARAILKKSDLIVLDEASTHLDERSTSYLSSLLSGHFKNKTCLVISHRPIELSTIDHVFWVDQGLITEVNDISMLSRSGRFA
jgi:ABC-type bacteriocin/lantibiotic exporter with double-glycine peptidase domain